MLGPLEEGLGLCEWVNRVQAGQIMESETPKSPTPLESTLTLLRAGKAGDRAALDRLYVRYLPRLSRWAKNRLPATARHLEDTSDVVQDVLVKFFTNKVDAFEPQHAGSLMAYLRTAVLNQIRDRIRKEGRRPEQVDADDVDLRAGTPSPYEEFVAQETAEQYEDALARLSSEERAAVILRVELDYSNEEIAEDLGKPSVDAARMFVHRAIFKLAKEMTKSGASGP
jgi:RNA polymerase sigma factor (sigma-70 family)